MKIVRHENYLLTPEELVEVEASENALEQAEAPRWPGFDHIAQVPKGKYPALQLPQFPGTKMWWNPTTACEEESSSLRNNKVSSPGLSGGPVMAVEWRNVSQYISVIQGWHRGHHGPPFSIHPRLYDKSNNKYIIGIPRTECSALFLL